jgi:hypothetical protein
MLELFVGHNTLYIDRRILATVWNGVVTNSTAHKMHDLFTAKRHRLLCARPAKPHAPDKAQSLQKNIGQRQ